jgi:integrase
MAKRRAPNEGTINQTSYGKWRAQVYLEGKRISKNFDSQRAAKTWIMEKRGQIEQGLSYNAATTTLGQFLAGWLETKKSKLRLHTYEQYRRTIRKYIEPHLGDLRFSDLTPDRIQAFYSRLQAQGVTARPVQVVHSVLHSALEHAARLGLVTRNPADLVMAPGTKKAQLSIWDESQVSQFLVAIKGQRNEILYHLALATGMRRGELLGLQWTDIDWQAGILRVERQVIEPEGGSFEFQEPKTNYGQRAIQLGPGLVGRLRQQLNLVGLARAFARDKWKEHNLIFPSTVGTPQNGYNLSKEFHRLCQAAGVPEIRLHDLRHTSASLMLNHGIPLIVVSRILGHSKPSITMDIYGHLLPGIQAGAAELMERLTTPVAVDL